MPDRPNPYTTAKKSQEDTYKKVEESLAAPTDSATEAITAEPATTTATIPEKTRRSQHRKTQTTVDTTAKGEAHQFYLTEDTFRRMKLLKATSNNSEHKFYSDMVEAALKAYLDQHGV